MHSFNFKTGGLPVAKAKKALIMVHGRGGTAEDILSLSDHLHLEDFALLAPQASGNSWYPYSFLVPPSQNEPWLTSALDVLNELLTFIEDKGIERDHIFLTGFSQGACLALEYAARNADRFGGIAAFTGGLIGDRIDPERYKGDFKGTPILIGSSNPDPHIPVQRVYETVAILESHQAKVTYKLYEAMGHTICQDEIQLANNLIFGT